MDNFDTIRYLTRSDVMIAAAEVDSVAVVRSALVEHACGRTTLPDEAYLPWSAHDGSFARSLALPAAVWTDAPSIGIKIINSSLANGTYGRPRAQGLTLLFDRDSARPVAIMEAAYLSALRTSAYSVLSVLLLGARQPEQVAIIGNGVLGESHVRLLGQTFPSLRFSLYDQFEHRRDDLTAALRSDGFDCRAAASAKEAVLDAEVVVATTTAVEGYIPFAWLAPGAVVAHVSLDDVLPDVVQRADLLVVDDWHLVSADDRRLLGRMYRTGELCGPQGQTHRSTGSGARRVDATLADIVIGSHPGRTDAGQIVLSNPFGMGVLDVALAAEVLRAAQRQDIGTMLPV